MARITVEDCLTQQTNRFGLVLLAAKRAKQLLHGAKQAIEDNRGNKAIVTALREIADGQVRFMSDEEAREAREREAAEAESRRAAAAAAVPARTAELTVRDIFIEDPAAEKEESTENRNGSSASGI